MCWTLLTNYNFFIKNINIEIKGGGILHRGGYITRKSSDIIFKRISVALQKILFLTILYEICTSHTVHSKILYTRKDEHW